MFIQNRLQRPDRKKNKIHNYLSYLIFLEATISTVFLWAAIFVDKEEHEAMLNKSYLILRPTLLTAALAIFLDLRERKQALRYDYADLIEQPDNSGEDSPDEAADIQQQLREFF